MDLFQEREKEPNESRNFHGILQEFTHSPSPKEKAIATKGSNGREEYSKVVSADAAKISVKVSCL